MASLTCAPPLQRRGNLHRLAPPQRRVIAAKAAIQVSAPSCSDAHGGHGPVNAVPRNV